MTAAGLPSGLYAVLAAVDGAAALVCAAGAGRPAALVCGFAPASAAARALRGSGHQGEPVPLTYAQAEAAAAWRPGPAARTLFEGPGWAAVQFEGAPWLNRGAGLPMEGPPESLLLVFRDAGGASVLMTRHGGSASPCGFATPGQALDFRWGRMPGGTALQDLKDTGTPLRLADYNLGTLRPPVVARDCDYVLTWQSWREEYMLVRLRETGGGE